MSRIPYSLLEAPHDPQGGGGGTAHHSSRLVERQAVLIGVDVSDGDEHWLPGRVTDISQNGCRLVFIGGLVPDMAIRVMFPGFAARAVRVVWVKDEQVGCVFEPPLPDAILDYLIRMSDPAARG